MKSLILIVLLSCVNAFAGGKFIFIPEGNFTKNENYLNMGISVYEKIFKPVSYVNYTGVRLEKDEHSSRHDMSDFAFKNALALHLGSKVDVEMGHKYLYNFGTSFGQHIGYTKVSADLW